MPAREPIRRRLDELLAIGVLSAPDAGTRPLLLSAARRPAEPAGAVLARGRRRRRPRRCRSQRARSGRHHRARLVLSRARTAAPGLRPLGERQRAERAPPARGGHGAHALPDRIPRTRAAALAWLPDGTGFYYTRYPAPGRCPTGEEHYHRAVYFHRARRPTRPPIRWSSSRREKEYWPGVSLSPDGRWLLISVARTFDQTDLYLQDLAAEGARWSRWPRTCRRRSMARSRTAGCSCAPTSTRPTYRLYAVDPERPDRGAWRELVPPRADAVLESVARRRRPAGPQLSRAGLFPAPAHRSRRRRSSRRSRCPTLGSLFGVGARVGRRGAVLRLLLLHRAAERLPDRPRRPASRRSGGGWRPTSIPTGSRSGR